MGVCGAVASMGGVWSDKIDVVDYANLTIFRTAKSRSFGYMVLTC